MMKKDGFSRRVTPFIAGFMATGRATFFSDNQYNEIVSL
jgi:hypothetical protein